MSGIKLISTGSALPVREVTNFDMEKLVETSDEWISTPYRHLGPPLLQRGRVPYQPLPGRGPAGAGAQRPAPRADRGYAWWLP